MNDSGKAIERGQQIHKLVEERKEVMKGIEIGQGRFCRE